MRFGKFNKIYRSFKRKRMKGMVKYYSKLGIIEEDFNEILPYLEKAFELGNKSKRCSLAREGVQDE